MLTVGSETWDVTQLSVGEGLILIKKYDADHSLVKVVLHILDRMSVQRNTEPIRNPRKSDD
jgi:hypothetical protein